MKKQNIAYFCICASALFFVSCGEKSTEKETISAETIHNPISANSEEAQDTANAPVMTFEKDVYDFGKIIQGEKVTHTFTFTNTGKTDLIISAANTSCGCTVPSFSKTPVKPGEKGKIDVVFDSEGKKGQTTKKITILANTIPNFKTITLTGEIMIPVGN
ncbi:MAG: DUF1573 domain-containing protein [Bacteroidia bacterium]|nr:DUF1573 domain-containing protein [Bacteroidia bacterium]